MKAIILIAIFLTLIAGCGSDSVGPGGTGNPPVNQQVLFQMDSMSIRNSPAGTKVTVDTNWSVIDTSLYKVNFQFNLKAQINKSGSASDTAWYYAYAFLTQYLESRVINQNYDSTYNFTIGNDTTKLANTYGEFFISFKNGVGVNPGYIKLSNLKLTKVK